MMVHIACCDDDKEQLAGVREYFETLAFQIQTHLEVDYYLSANILMQKCRSDGNYYDIYLLDVEMPDVNGMELGEEIRKMAGRDAIIIYLTNYPRYMHQSFQVQAFQYMIKPLDYEPFKEEIMRAIRYLSNDNKSIIFKNAEQEEIVFRLKNILYIEKEKGLKLMNIIHTNGRDAVCGNMNLYEDKLLAEGFVKISRSTIVNMEHIHKIVKDELVLDNGMRVRASMRKTAEIRSRLAKYIMSGVV